MKAVRLLTFSASVALASFIAFPADEKPRGPGGGKGGGKRPQDAPLDDVRACLPADENGLRKNGAVSFSYELRPR